MTLLQQPLPFTNEVQAVFKISRIEMPAYDPAQHSDLACEIIDPFNATVELHNQALCIRILQDGALIHCTVQEHEYNVSHGFFGVCGDAGDLTFYNDGHLCSYVKCSFHSLLLKLVKQRQRNVNPYEQPVVRRRLIPSQLLPHKKTQELSTELKLKYGSIPIGRIIAKTPGLTVFSKRQANGWWQVVQIMLQTNLGLDQLILHDRETQTVLPFLVTFRMRCYSTTYPLTMLKN